MVKRLAVAVLVLALMVGCSCPLMMGTLDRLDQSMARQHRLYLQYVEKDPSLTEGQKQAEKENVQSQKDLVQSIRKAHE